MAEGYVTTHVLDAGRGCPAAGMRVELWRLDGGDRRLVREVVTNADGRTDGPVIPKGEMEVGVWELVFHAGAYLDAAGVAGEAVRFLDVIPIRFGWRMRGSTITCRCCWRGIVTRRIGGVEGQSSCSCPVSDRRATART